LPGGEGAGDAGDAEEGLRRLIPPDPLHIPFPFAAPPEARGREVTLQVFVTATGAVDSVRLADPTPNRDFNATLVRQAHDWTFKPARRGGREVAAWFRYTWRIP
jgi:TonB family protein